MDPVLASASLYCAACAPTSHEFFLRLTPTRHYTLRALAVYPRCSAAENMSSQAIQRGIATGGRSQRRPSEPRRLLISKNRLTCASWVMGHRIMARICGRFFIAANNPAKASRSASSPPAFAPPLPAPAPPLPAPAPTPSSGNIGCRCSRAIAGSACT